MSDGTMRVAFVYNVGSFPKDLILDQYYEDRRKFEIKILSFKTDEHNMTHDHLQQITNSFSNQVEGDDNFLIFAPYGLTKDIMLNKRTAYFRNYGGSTAHLLAQAALVTAAKAQEPHTLTPSDQEYLQYFEDNKWRFGV
ncbi:hypothetical protein [Lysinibacillus xylanilyticus]|uniref:hypothetical protein n=1 Tax=Lysinibacillus xylanilyticus TaxID=582475 RepID=UPI0036DF53E1